MWERVGCVGCHSNHKYCFQKVLLVIYLFLSMSEKESVIVKALISVHALGKQGQNKRHQSLQDALTPHPLGL